MPLTLRLAAALAASCVGSLAAARPHDDCAAAGAITGAMIAAQFCNAWETRGSGHPAYSGERETEAQRYCTWRLAVSCRQEAAATVNRERPACRARIAANWRGALVSWHRALERGCPYSPVLEPVSCPRGGVPVLGRFCRMPDGRHVAFHEGAWKLFLGQWVDARGRTHYRLRGADGRGVSVTFDDLALLAMVDLRMGRADL